MSLNLDKLELLHQIHSGNRTLSKIAKVYGYKTTGGAKTILIPLEKEGFLYRDESRKLLIDEVKLEKTFKDIVVYINWFRCHYKTIKPQKTVMRKITKIKSDKVKQLIKKNE